MGLDQYAYVAEKSGQKEAYYEDAEFDPVTNAFVNPNMTEPRELASWRKHPNLQGWMEKLWFDEKGGAKLTLENPSIMFNGIEIELTWEDIDKLEKDIKSGKVAKLNTKGFFFGNPSDDIYRDRDLKFCVDAKAELFLGLKVFYNSSW